MSEYTYELIKDKFDCEYRGELKVKNHGKMKMYFVNGPIAENGLEKKSTRSEKK